MRKLLLALISVLFLTSCAPEVIPANIKISPSPIALEADTSVTASLISPLTTPSLTASIFGENERVSENFNTVDFKKIFTLSSEELCTLLGSGFEDSDFDESGGTIIYKSLGASFEYSLNLDDKNILYDFEPHEEEPVLTLQRIVLTTFDFRGLNPMSDFEDVINILGNSDQLILHNDKGYYYALRYAFSNLLFEFSSADQKGSGGLILSVMVSSGSNVFYKSCGEGDSVSKTLTTGDIKLFLGLTPEEMDGIIGNGSTSEDEDTGSYIIYFKYLGVYFLYEVNEVEQGEDVIAYPVFPVEYIWVDDFEFRGLNNKSTFKDVMQVLGEGKIREIPAEDTSYFALQYKIDGMLFQFTGYDKKASDGVDLSIMSDKS